MRPKFPRLTRHAFGAVALAVAAVPAALAAQQSDDGRDIIVTAQSADDTRRALDECLARHCPPDEDMRLTLAHAENQFVAGDYRHARGTMLASLGRNRRFGEQFPVEVSDLMRANARVAAHLGEAEAYMYSLSDMRRTLENAFGSDDARVLAAQIEVADARARLGHAAEARAKYQSIAADATRLNLPRIAAFAQIRDALSDLGGEPAQRNRSRVRAASAVLAHIAGNGAAVGSDLALVADVILARVEREAGDMTRTNALITRFAAGQGATRPLLVSGDPIALPDRTNIAEDLIGMNAALQRLGPNVDNRWVDVGYWINADGRVGDVEVLRSQGGGHWVQLVENSIKSRQYTPLRREASLGSPGFYMVERYTLTAHYRRDCTGSMLRCRDPQLTIERMDLTPEESARAAS